MLINSCSFCIYSDRQIFKIHHIQVLNRPAFNTGISIVGSMVLAKDSRAKLRGQKVKFANGQLLHVQRIRQIKGAGAFSMKVHGMLR